MDIIPLNTAGAAGKMILGAFGLFAASVLWTMFCQLKGIRALRASLIFALLGFGLLWLAWRTPDEIGLAPGTVELRYPGLRPSRTFHRADIAGVEIKYFQALYGEPEHWNIKLYLADGDEILLMTENSIEAAQAFSARIKSAIDNPAGSPPK